MGGRCCDEDAARPPLGAEIVVDGLVTEQPIRDASVTWHVARLRVAAVCLVPRGR